MNGGYGENGECNFTTPPEDFAIEEPLPVLVLTLPGHPPGESNGVPAADPARLVAAASEYEVSLGGEGLYPFDPIPPVGPGAVALVPWKADGARGRLERVGRWAVASAHLAADARVA